MKPFGPSGKPESDGDDCHGNLLFFEGRKCLLLTHADTLFTIFEPDVRVPGLRSTQGLVTWLIERELVAETLPLGTIGALETETLLIARPRIAACSAA